MFRMKEQYPEKRGALLVPLLVLSCGVMIVFLILVHFVWQMRYQELSRELAQQRISLVTHQRYPVKATSDASNISYRSGPQTLCSYVAEPAAVKADLSPSSQITPRDTLYEMFEGEFPGGFRGMEIEEGEQLLAEAGMGLIPLDVEYRLDALVALKEITGNPLAPDLAMNMFDLLEESSDRELRLVMLRTLQGSVGTAITAELIPYLEDPDPSVRNLSFHMIASNLRALEHNPSVDGERKIFLDYIRRYPEAILQYSPD